jgi:hypothetical protein
MSPAAWAFGDEAHSFFGLQGIVADPDGHPREADKAEAEGNIRVAKERFKAAGGTIPGEISDPESPRAPLEVRVRAWEKAAEAAEAAQAARTPQAETERTKTDRLSPTPRDG